MTMQAGRLIAAGDAAGPSADSERLALFDQIRALFVATRLPPDPQVYDLFWRYVCDDDHQLSRAVDEALASGRFDMVVVTALRQTHCGDVGLTGVAALVEAAHGQAEALTQLVEAGQTDVAAYGRALSDGGAALAARSTRVRWRCCSTSSGRRPQRCSRRIRGCRANSRRPPRRRAD